MLCFFGVIILCVGINILHQNYLFAQFSLKAFLHSVTQSTLTRRVTIDLRGAEKSVLSNLRNESCYLIATKLVFVSSIEKCILAFRVFWCWQGFVMGRIGTGISFGSQLNNLALFIHYQGKQRLERSTREICYTSKVSKSSSLIFHLLI